MLVSDSVNELSESAQLWIDCEDARARSAVSRGYYAAFRVLKSRLLTSRDEWRTNRTSFPVFGVHAKVKKALEAHLSEKHRLVREMKALLRRRNELDYEFTPFVRCEEVFGDLDAADNAIDLIEALTMEEVAGIAFELWKLSAEDRAGRESRRT